MGLSPRDPGEVQPLTQKTNFDELLQNFFRLNNSVTFSKFYPKFSTTPRDFREDLLFTTFVDLYENKAQRGIITHMYVHGSQTNLRVPQSVSSEHPT